MAERGRCPDAPGDSAGTSFFLSVSGKLGQIVVLSDLMSFCCVQSDLTLMSPACLLSPILPLNPLFSRWLSRSSLYWQLFLSSHLQASLKTVFYFFDNVSWSCLSADSAPPLPTPPTGLHPIFKSSPFDIFVQPTEFNQCPLLEYRLIWCRVSATVAAGAPVQQSQNV